MPTATERRWRNSGRPQTAGPSAPKPASGDPAEGRAGHEARLANFCLVWFLVDRS